MTQLPRYTNPDAEPCGSGGPSSYGGIPQPVYPYGTGAEVVLFDPATDTSPYAAKRGKAKRGRAPAEKPSARPKSAAQAAPRAADAFARAVDASAAAGRQAHPRPTVGSSPATRTSARGSLRIVPDDPREIRRYAEEQHQSESYRRAAAVPGSIASDRPSPGRTGAYAPSRPTSAPRGGTRAAEPVPPASDCRSAATTASRMPVAERTRSAYEVDDGPARPAARRGKPAARPEPDDEFASKPSVRRTWDAEHLWRIAMVWATTLAAVFTTVVMLYFPSQELYLSVRENERLADEYEQNLARNAQMRDRVASLQTPEGIQDEARRLYGLTLPGENVVTVTGADHQPPSSATPAAVPRGSGENTQTWASDLLDRVFGVTGGTTSAAEAHDVATVTEASGAGVADATADIVAQGDKA